ncbi:hypothetical protein BV25DRAFT_750776 [Artomyces pyxidatus]|uniref:Uncharacterized protein n=1 Tax=Artomyces pyxidatus TaxID=48021 RepID=A0ACB8SEU8_9AGAM|nr:hypothetical protein BV25DRAFT_750776 [Artomyces pyxidatus]
MHEHIILLTSRRKMIDIPLVIECILYGIYTLLFTIVLAIILTKPRTITNVCMLAVTGVMFGIASARIVLHVYLENNPTLSRQTLVPLVLEVYLSSVNFVLGDAIVVWRAWVIWDYSYRIMVIPILLLAATTGVVAADLVSAVHFAVAFQEGSSSNDSLFEIFGWVIAATLGTNFIVTGLIGYRTWYDLRNYAGVFTDRIDCRIRHRTISLYQFRVGRDGVQALFILLVESGALYCCIWVVYLPLYLKYSNDPNLAFNVFDTAIPQLISIYPTLIIVLCSLQRSYHETVMASNSADPPEVMPQYSSKTYMRNSDEDVFASSKDPQRASRVAFDVRPTVMFYKAPSPDYPSSYTDLDASSADLAADTARRRPDPVYQ